MGARAAIPVAIIVTAPIGLTADRRASLTVPLLLVGALALASGLVLTVFAARSITEPVEALRDAQARVGDGALEVEVAVHDAGEVGLLQAGFNRMVAGLRERHLIRELFGRHVGAEVARRALSQNPELGGESEEASMLFVDLTGSTALAQRLPAQQVVALLNEFFSAVVRTTSAEGGWVNKFEGDATLCVFGPPDDEPDHAGRALRAARRLQQELAGLSSEHGGLDAGIGVSTGTVVAGNVGAEDRYEYTVIGDPVNEAARLTDEANELPAACSPAAPRSRQPVTKPLDGNAVVRSCCGGGSSPRSSSRPDQAASAHVVRRVSRAARTGIRLATPSGRSRRCRSRLGARSVSASTTTSRPG